MKKLARVWLILLMTVGPTSATGARVLPLRLTLEVIGERNCHLSASTQGLELKVKLKFVNSGDKTLTIQDIGWPGLVLVAKTRDEMEKGILEVRSNGEDFDLHRAQNQNPISLQPGNSFETINTVSLTVARRGTASSGLDVTPGTHYLQVGNAVTIGTDDPRTWNSIPLRSTPVIIRVEYSANASPCERNNTTSPMLPQ